jgi:hypothetical protein
MATSNIKRFWSVPLMLGLLAAGCATLSEEECVVGDWRQIGFTDGAAGKPADILRNHGKACAKYNVGTDYELWRAGYEAGLDIFCTPESAFAVGARGESYGGVCSGDRADSFQMAYADGRLLHDAISDAHYERDRVRDAENQVDELRDDRDEARRRSEDNTLTEAERRAALREVSRINDALDDEKDDLRDAQFRYDRARSEANILRDSLLMRYPGVNRSGLPSW